MFPKVLNELHYLQSVAVSELFTVYPRRSHVPHTLSLIDSNEKWLNRQTETRHKRLLVLVRCDDHIRNHLHHMLPTIYDYVPHSTGVSQLDNKAAQRLLHFVSFVMIILEMTPPCVADNPWHCSSLDRNFPAGQHDTQSLFSFETFQWNPLSSIHQGHPDREQRPEGGTGGQ